MSHLWNATIYSQFLELRTRPARDLLAAIPKTFNPKQAYDLGCGPGNSTILLKERWPGAEIIGLDSSEDMLKEARTTYPDIKFLQGNIADFSPSQKTDCLFANASLQWLDHHEILIPHLFKLLNPGGFLAIQIPNNFHTPTHQTTAQLLKNNPDWKRILENTRFGELQKPLYHLPDYYDIFTGAGANIVQLWETEYFQEMNTHQDIFDWVKGTGLRPVLLQMDSVNQALFEKAYIEKIAKVYPIQANGKVLLPFKRIFLVGMSS